MLQTMLERCLSDDYDFLRDFQKTPPMKQDELSDTFLKLAKKLSLKSEILAQERDHTKTLVTDISHQLKTPLSALKTCFFVYLEADTPEEKEEFGRRCQFQLEKLENLTASLIHISRLENAMILLRPAPVSLTQILIDAVNAVYEKAQSKEIILDIGDFEDITLSLDLKWTAEALFNILDNAVKYSETGSQILIRVQPLYSFVRLEIEDQGIGIPRGEYNNIFKRFYRVQNETVQKAEGSGVGLYLSRKILEEQGGTLSVKAAREQGSIFVVQLPLSSRIP
ncbi:MAG: HAMP domain-containing histidine kinase [Lachnospiraceae bacterium]|nr:HAMP domain-containing histidine kinase [Lachnospiraceae bacterium]